MQVNMQKLNDVFRRIKSSEKFNMKDKRLAQKRKRGGL